MYVTCLSKLTLPIHIYTFEMGYTIQSAPNNVMCLGLCHRNYFTKDVICVRFILFVSKIRNRETS